MTSSKILKPMSLILFLNWMRVSTSKLPKRKMNPLSSIVCIFMTDDVNFQIPHLRIGLMTRKQYSSEGNL